MRKKKKNPGNTKLTDLFVSTVSSKTKNSRKLQKMAHLNITDRISSVTDQTGRALTIRYFKRGMFHFTKESCGKSQYRGKTT